jgi:uracil-DNA glycosylase
MQDSIKRIDIPDDWYNVLKHYIESPQFTEIGKEIAKQRKEGKVFPKREETFRAFQVTPFKKIKIVIIGMDPYPNEYKGEPVACGLSFATRDVSNLSPSSRQIFNCLKRSLYSNDLLFPQDMDIASWAKQGVLMLNASLTVRAGEAGSHLKLWENFTTEVIKAIDRHLEGVVFCLWGKDAQKFGSLIGEDNKCLIAPHPVAASYNGGQWECDHFFKINNYLNKRNETTIKWIQLP